MEDQDSDGIVRYRHVTKGNYIAADHIQPPHLTCSHSRHFGVVHDRKITTTSCGPALLQML